MEKKMLGRTSWLSALLLLSARARRPGALGCRRLHRHSPAAAARAGGPLPAGSGPPRCPRHDRRAAGHHRRRPGVLQSQRFPPRRLLPVPPARRRRDQGFQHVDRRPGDPGRAARRRQGARASTRTSCAGCATRPCWNTTAAACSGCASSPSSPAAGKGSRSPTTRSWKRATAPSPISTRWAPRNSRPGPSPRSASSWTSIRRRRWPASTAPPTR